MSTFGEGGQFYCTSCHQKPGPIHGEAHEVVKGDLTDNPSLKEAFRDAYGVFVVTNWRALMNWLRVIQRYKRQRGRCFPFCLVNTPGCRDNQWRTIACSSFYGQSQVDELIRNSGFSVLHVRSTTILFSKPQWTAGCTAPTGWQLRMDTTDRSDEKGIHMADINDLGKVVAGAFCILIRSAMAAIWPWLPS